MPALTNVFLYLSCKLEYTRDVFRIMSDAMKDGPKHTSV